MCKGLFWWGGGIKQGDGGQFGGRDGERWVRSRVLISGFDRILTCFPLFFSELHLIQ